MITPQFENCANLTADNVTKLFPFNLRILTEFFEKEDLADLRTGKMLSEELQVIIPTLEFESKKGEHVGAEREVKADIRRLVNKIKNGKKIYESHAELLAEKVDQMDREVIDSVFNWKDGMLIATASVAGMSFIVIMILMMKISKLWSMVMLVQAVKATEEEVTKRMLIYYRKPEVETETETVNQPTAEEYDRYSEWNKVYGNIKEHSPMTMYLVALIVVIIGLCLLRKLYRS